MKIGTIGLRFFSVLLFSFGTIIAIILYGGVVWSDFEASLFDSSFTAEKPLSSFKCPVMMTTSETVYIKAAFTNPLDRTFRPFIQFHMSEGYVTFKSEFKTTLELEPGETQELEWEVTPEMAAWDRFVLARVLQFRRYPVPSQGAACGIVVVDFPALTGNQLLAIVTLTSIICMGIGGWIWIRNNRPLEGRKKLAAQIMTAMGITSVGGMFVSYLGWWLLGGLILVLNGLLVVALLSEFFLAE